MPDPIHQPLNDRADMDRAFRRCLEFAGGGEPYREAMQEMARQCLNARPGGSPTRNEVSQKNNGSHVSNDNGMENPSAGERVPKTGKADGCSI